MDQVIYKEATRTMFSSFLAKRRERKKGRYLFGEGKKGEKNVSSFHETTIIYAGRCLIYSSAVSNLMTNSPQKLTELILSFSVMYDIA